MRTFVRTCLFPLVLVTIACAQQASTGPAPTAGFALGGSQAAASPLTATIQFGKPNVGTSFPPTSGHDQSSHAKDNLVPRTVVIGTGGTVTFKTFGVHQMAIYAPGTKPGDVDQSIVAPLPAGCPPEELIDDPTNRVALVSRPCGPAGDMTYTFTSPGRYLVICAFKPHFAFFDMYGWVEVK